MLIADDVPRSRAGLRALLSTAQLGPAWIGEQDETVEACPTVEVVGEAADGQETVRLVEERQPDVVLMDARMPVMDGLEATRTIKDRWPEIKVVVLTMYCAFRADALAAGADAFLVKGCSPEELLAAIMRGFKEE